MVEAHRSLIRGDYVHVDVSDDFSEAAKWSVVGLYTVVLFLLRTSKNRRNQAAISAAGAMAMVIGRSILHKIEQGPVFVVHRSFIVEPLLVCFGNLFIMSCYLKTATNTVTPFYDMFNKFSSISRYANSIAVMTTAAAITAVLGDYSAALLLSPMCLTDSSKLALLSGMTVGATLSMTGSLSNMLAVAVAYDDIYFAAFVADKLWPSLAAFVIYAVALKFYVSEQDPPYQDVRRTTNHPVYYETEYNETATGDEGDRNTKDLTTPSAGIEVDKAQVGGESLVLEVVAIPAEIDREAQVAEDLGVLEMDIPVPLIDGGIWLENRDCALIAIIIVHLVVMGIVWQIDNLMAVAFFAVADVLGASYHFFLYRFFGGFQICVVIMLILLTFAVDMVTVSLAFCAFWLYYSEWNSRGNEASQQPSPLSQVDFNLLINLAGQLVVTSSMTDTGLHAKLFLVSLDGCAEQITSSQCVFYFAAIVAILTVVTSRFQMNIILAATYPYSYPYDWMQVTLVTSLVGNLTWTAFDRPRLGNPFNYVKFMVPTAIVSIVIGVQLLSMFHVSLDCSERLGTCP